MPVTAAAAYRKWAEVEAKGVSEIYYHWASGIAESPVALDLITSLPREKWQPNLVFGAARFAGAPLGPARQFINWLTENWESVVPVILARATQTNEAGRCAVLLPVLSKLTGPLALIEAGASAGLCLYPDQYSYQYTSKGETTKLDPLGGASDVILPCSIDSASAPSRLPEVVWRAGADLNPLDPTNVDEMAWLEALIWPEHEERRERLKAAALVAASNPPQLVQGDLVDRIPTLVEQAPAGAQVVVFHSAVLVYLTPERREEFVQLVTSLPNVIWISNEGEGVLPRVSSQVQEPINGRTILSLNQKPVALVGPHGQSYKTLDAKQ